MKRFSLVLVALLLAITSVMSISTSVIYAADESSSGAGCDEQFYSANDILFYNPCATTCSTGGAGGAGTVDKLRGKNNGEKIFNFWVDAGLSAQQAAGITGSMKHEGGFSPFRQEMGKPWPNWGWGIAQFTGQPAPNHPDTGGQRASAKAYVRNAIGADLFDQYYKADYGGFISESDGFVPKGVPVDVNDKFLLAQLNYLLEYIKDFKPSSISDRVNGLKADFGQDVPSGTTLYDYLHSIVQAPDAAIAWTYLYEWPGNRIETSKTRANSASNILELYANGISTSCGGNLTAGGMTLDEAKKFMKDYTSNPDNVKYIGGAAQGCTGGPLSNCVSFSAYFINKYTNIKGFGDGTSPGNGSTVVANIVARNPGIENGHSPRPYAIFSTPSGNQMCDSDGNGTLDIKCGHTGVILGVDTANKKVIVGEAACGGAADWDTAREYPLSQFDSDEYTYAYTDGLLKGTVN